VTPLAVVAVIAIGVVAAGVLGATIHRRRVRQHPRPARTFVVIGLAVLPIPVAMALATGTLLAAVPAAAVSALCLAAGWSFHPRFADFERAFRAYAEQHGRHRQ